MTVPSTHWESRRSLQKGLRASELPFRKFALTETELKEKVNRGRKAGQETAPHRGVRGSGTEEGEGALRRAAPGAAGGAGGRQERSGASPGSRG